MKFASLFLGIGLLLALQSYTRGGWWWFAVWPAVSLLAVSFAYARNSPTIFGKRRDGTRSVWSSCLLLPYLSCVWLVWHLMRLVWREDAWDQVDEQLVIGRRLLASEFPAHVVNVVDLTCEFSEPIQIRGRVARYIAVPILDGTGICPDRLLQIVKQINSLDGVTMIHCAQGHGRTGMVAAAILAYRSVRADQPIWNGSCYVSQALSADEAIAKLKIVRPLLRCNQAQVDALIGVLINSSAEHKSPQTRNALGQDS